MEGGGFVIYPEIFREYASAVRCDECRLIVESNEKETKLTDQEIRLHYPDSPDNPPELS